MIINKINIEGICKKEELKKLSFKEANILNKDLEININNTYGIKDILEISIDAAVVSSKVLEFNDETIITVTIETSFDILAIENIEYNTLSAIREKEYVNYTFKAKDKEIELDKITVKIIDCYFKIGNERTVVGTLTYLVNENSNKISVNNKVENVKFKLIDLCQEFA